MNELTKLIKDDMAVALGVTEPGAIAFCAAKARSLIGGELVGILDVDWVGVLSVAATAAVLSLLTSVAGLPEVPEE